MIRFRFCFCARFGRWAAAVCAGRDMILPPWRRMRRTETRRRAFAPTGMYLLGYRAKRRKTAVNAPHVRALSSAHTFACRMRRGGRQNAAGRAKSPRPDTRSGADALARLGLICNAWTCRTGRQTAAGTAERYNTCDHLQCYCIISGRGCQEKIGLCSRCMAEICAAMSGTW